MVIERALTPVCEQTVQRRHALEIGVRRLLEQRGDLQRARRRSGQRGRAGGPPDDDASPREAACGLRGSSASGPTCVASGHWRDGQDGVGTAAHGGVVAPSSRGGPR